MPFCQKCGHEIMDGETACPNCGAPVGGQAPVKATPAPQVGLTTIELVAFVFMIIGTIAMAFAIIPLVWCIPMTIHAKKAMDDHQKIGVGFKVCTLLFVSLIGGILLLVRDESACN